MDGTNVVLNSIVKVGLIEKVRFEQRLEVWELAKQLSATRAF